MKGTIVFGNDATYEDAYAIIILDRMKDLGFSSDDINGFVDKYRKNHKGETLIAEGKIRHCMFLMGK